MAEKHIVGYTHASTSYGHSYGERFDRLHGACDNFDKWFNSTGNTKYRSFNSRSPEDKSGINLTQRGGISLVLRLSDPVTEDHLKFCPFCGAEVELKCTKSVQLNPKTKEIPDGYEEMVKWQETDETTRVKEDMAKQP